MPDTPLHTTRLPVRWGDMDALGHVNNAAYLTYVEQARIEFLQSLAESPWPATGDAPPEAGPILVAAEVTFRKPVVYPAMVVVDVFGGEVGRTSFPLTCSLTVEGDEGTVYASVHTTLVWVDRATGRPVPVPEALRQRLVAG